MQKERIGDRDKWFLLVQTLLDYLLEKKIEVIGLSRQKEEFA